MFAVTQLFCLYCVSVCISFRGAMQYPKHAYIPHNKDFSMFGGCISTQVTCNVLFAHQVTQAGLFAFIACLLGTTSYIQLSTMCTGRYLNTAITQYHGNTDLLQNIFALPLHIDYLIILGMLLDRKKKLKKLFFCQILVGSNYKLHNYNSKT